MDIIRVDMVTMDEIVVRLLLGTLIGGIIGFERQVHGRPAGFRTHILVCVACVLLMLLSEHYYALNVRDSGYVRADPGRIAAGAITGIGFLGAGVVLKTGFSIQGLTTAACIWAVSAIGLSIGGGLYEAGILTFLITIVTLTCLRMLEKKVPKLSFRELTIEGSQDIDEALISATLKKYGARITNTTYEASLEDRRAVFSLTIAFYRRFSIKNLVDDLASLASVRKVSLRS